MCVLMCRHHSYKLLGQFTDLKVGLPKESTASAFGFSTATGLSVIMKSQSICLTKDSAQCAECAQVKNLHCQPTSAQNPIPFSQAGHDIATVATGSLTSSRISMVEIKTLLRGVCTFSVMELFLNNFKITGKVVTSPARYSNSSTQCNLVQQLSHLRCQYIHIHKYSAAGATPKSLLPSGSGTFLEADHSDSGQFIAFDVSDSEKNSESSLSYTSISGKGDISSEEFLNKDLSNDDIVSELIQRLESLYITALDTKEEF